MNETWAPIPSCPGYAASSLGRIQGPRGLLSMPATRGGYLTCSVRRAGVKHTTTVQRLVLEAFVGAAPTEAHEANHKNGVKTENRPENLEWMTPAENKLHAIEVLGKKNGRPPKPKRIDPRRPFLMPLKSAGYRDLHIEPRIGYVAWRALDADTGELLHCAALKELLRWVAAQVPRMMAERNFH